MDMVLVGYTVYEKKNKETIAKLTIGQADALIEELKKK